MASASRRDKSPAAAHQLGMTKNQNASQTSHAADYRLTYADLPYAEHRGALLLLSALELDAHGQTEASMRLLNSARVDFVVPAAYKILATIAELYGDRSDRVFDTATRHARTTFSDRKIARRIRKLGHALADVHLASWVGHPTLPKDAARRLAKAMPDTVDGPDAYDTCLAALVLVEAALLEAIKDQSGLPEDDGTVDHDLLARCATVRDLLDRKAAAS